MTTSNPILSRCGGWHLVDKNGEAIVAGQVVKDFRGDPMVVDSGEPPRHEGSSGRVYCLIAGVVNPQGFYPSVIDAKWVKAPFTYRAPTELMHVDGGWLQITAPDAVAALAIIRKRTPCEEKQLQVRVDGFWRFADIQPQRLGGLEGIDMEQAGIALAVFAYLFLCFEDTNRRRRDELGMKPRTRLGFIREASHRFPHWHIYECGDAALLPLLADYFEHETAPVL